MSTIQEWFRLVQKEEKLQTVLMSHDQLGSKELLSVAAAEHGVERRRVGYTAAMLVEESRMLQVSIFPTLQNNLASIDFSLLLIGVMTIADEIDSQLSQACNTPYSVGKSVLKHPKRRPRSHMPAPDTFRQTSHAADSGSEGLSFSNSSAWLRRRAAFISRDTALRLILSCRCASVVERECFSNCLPRFSAESASSLSCDIADDLLLGICVGINSHIVRCTERLGIWLVRARKRIRVVRAIGAHILKGGYEGCYPSALFLQGYNAGASNSCKGESRLRSTKTTVRVVAESVPDPTVVLTGPDRFTRFSVYSSRCLGSRWAFLSAIAVIALWAFTGSLFHYSDTWQLVINTGTTIVTFLMVFIIQNTQNRDARAIHLKLNELIHAIDKAKNKMIEVESLSDCELEELAKTYETIRRSAQDRQASRQVLK